MMMNKKLFSLGLVLVFTIGMSVPAFASEGNGVFAQTTAINSEVEIMRAVNGISDVPITQEMRDRVSASFIAEDGSVTVLEPEITVRKLNNASTLSANGSGDQYVMTAVARTSTRDEDSFNNAAWAWGVVTYTKNGIGQDNLITSAEGGWKEGSGAEISNAKAFYGSSITDSNPIAVGNLGFYQWVNEESSNFNLDTIADVTCRDSNGNTTMGELNVSILIKKLL